MPTTIADLARSVLRQPAANVTGWRVEPVDYDFGSPTTDGLFRILGTARVGDTERAWSVFVKLVRAYRHWPLFEILPADLRAAASAGDQWRYEADVYRSGLPGALPDGLRLPIVHRIIDLGDDRLAIVLEDVATLPEPLGRRTICRRRHPAGTIRRPRHCIAQSAPQRL